MKKVALTVIVLMLGCIASAVAQTAQVPVRIAWQMDPNAPLYLARDKQMFEEAGIQPEYIKFLAAPPMFAALQSGSVDIADMGLAPAIIAKSQGIDIKIVMIALDVSGSNALVTQKNLVVKNGKDLKGMRIGAQRGTTPYLGLVKFLEKDGLGISDIKFIDLTAPNIIPAFKKEEIDAAWVWSPWQNMLIAAGGKRVTTNKAIQAYAPQVWAVRTGWARANPEVLQKFIATIDKSLRQIDSNRDLALRPLILNLNVDASIGAEMLKENDFPTVSTQSSQAYALSPAFGYPGASGGLSLVTKQTADFLHSQGIIKATVNPDDLIDPGPMKKYLGIK